MPSSKDKSLEEYSRTFHGIFEIQNSVSASEAELNEIFINQIDIVKENEEQSKLQIEKILASSEVNSSEEIIELRDENKELNEQLVKLKDELERSNLLFMSEKMALERQFQMEKTEMEQQYKQTVEKLNEELFSVKEHCAQREQALVNEVQIAQASSAIQLDEYETDLKLELRESNSSCLKLRSELQKTRAQYAINIATSNKKYADLQRKLQDTEKCLRETQEKLRAALSLQEKTQSNFERAQTNLSKPESESNASVVNLRNTDEFGDFELDDFAQFEQMYDEMNSVFPQADEYPSNDFSSSRSGPAKEPVSTNQFNNNLVKANEKANTKTNITATKYQALEVTTNQANQKTDFDEDFDAVEFNNFTDLPCKKTRPAVFRGSSSSKNVSRTNANTVRRNYLPPLKPCSSASSRFTKTTTSNVTNSSTTNVDGNNSNSPATNTSGLIGKGVSNVGNNKTNSDANKSNNLTLNNHTTKKRKLFDPKDLDYLEELEIPD